VYCLELYIRRMSIICDRKSEIDVLGVVGVAQ
jgi:hypothetical protein